jgi:hypothetical protein
MQKFLSNKKNVNLIIFFFISAVLIVRYQIYLLDYREWGDESETIVVAKMMASGLKLYSEIFEPHAPLVYLPSLLIEKLGSFNLHTHRIFILILQLLALTALFFSPLLKNLHTRINFTLTAALAILVAFQKFYSNTYIYQNIAGLLIFIAMVQYILPSLAEEKRIGNFTIILGNFILGCLPFLGIIYLPISILFFIGSLRKKYNHTAYISYFLGILANFLFLSIIGSISGLYAYHIYLNASILPRYALEVYPTSLLEFFINSTRALITNLSGFITLALIVILSINYLFKENIFKWKRLLNFRFFVCLIGIGTLLIRGSDVHGLPYYFAMLCLPILFSNKTYNDSNKMLIWSAGLMALIIYKISFLFPFELARIQSKKIEANTEFSRLVRQVTSKNDRIIAYTWQPYEYIASDRLPASGYLTYFPWQVDYNKHPMFNTNIDGCSQIEKYKPKIMLIDKWNLWGKFSWESYGECIDRITEKYYIKIKNKPYYLRKDLYFKYEKNN